MESALITAPPRRRARFTARADLPLAVGPAMRMAWNPCATARHPLNTCKAMIDHVATLVCHPERPALSDALLARVAQVLPEAQSPRMLNPELAADIPFRVPAAATDEPYDARAQADRARAALDGAAVDVIVQPVAVRRKRLFLADMDSTMIGQECIDELADFVGLKDRVSAITERAMRGELAFEPALRERVALLAGLDVGVVDRIIAERITLTPGGPALVRT